MNDLTLKIPPHSVEAEQAVLGGVMQHAPALDDVADIVSEDDFYSKAHKLIWRSVVALDGRTVGIDAVTVGEHLHATRELLSAGGMEYIGALVSNTPSIANIKTYARIVRDKSLERRMITALENGLDEVWQAGNTAEKLDKAAQLVTEAMDVRGGNGPKRASESLPAWVDSLEERHEKGGQVIGLTTGFKELDWKLAGLQKSDLIIIAGRPSMGKTTFAVNIAENIAVDSGVPVAVFSMEMPTEQIITKMHSSHGRIRYEALRTGDLREDEWSRLTASMQAIKDAPIFIDDSPALTPHELKARARRLHRREGIGLVVIDYLQLMRVHGFNNNRRGEIEEISRSLKALAKELRIPVVCLSQLSRAVENRPNKRPVMSDLRESGAIEQDADVVMFVYRDEVYDEQSADKGTAEINVAKQRTGPIGKVKVVSQLHFSRFEDYGA